MRKKETDNTVLGDKIDIIHSIQALRTMAFLGIFFSHADFVVSWPGLGVSVFFVLSGFLTYRKHEREEYNISFTNNLAFSRKKISRLYPLHILTMCLAIVLAIGDVIHKGHLISGFAVLSGETILNVTLTQTWFPYLNVNVSLNGVAWYLSTSMFLYYMFPFIKRWIQSKHYLFLCIVCLIVLGLEIVVCIPMITIFGGDSLVYIWFMYCFPVFRLGDFFVGCCLSKCYIERKQRTITALKASLYEIMALVITLLVFKWLAIAPCNVFIEAMHNWTTIYIPIAAVWILLFTENKGIITRVLSNKITIFLGNISSYMFLIHYVMIQWIKTGLKYMNIELRGWRLCLLVFVELAVTIVLSWGYGQLRKKRGLYHGIST